MRIDVKVPDLSAAKGADIPLRRRLVPEGAPAKRGEPLLEVEIEGDRGSRVAGQGIVGVILARPDVKIAVEQVVARIEVDP